MYCLEARWRSGQTNLGLFGARSFGHPAAPSTLKSKLVGRKVMSTLRAYVTVVNWAKI